MDVILVEPPLYRWLPSKRSQPQLGLAYIASYLLSKGLRIKIIDGLVDNRTVADIVEEIYSLSPLAVGITTMSEDRFNAIELCNRVKSKLNKTFVFAGGPHFSHSAKDALENVAGLDAIVIGEGEITTWELLQNFINNRNVHSFNNINGCAFRDENGRVIITPSRSAIADLDEIPGPAWHLFDINKYHGTLTVEEKTRAIGVISSRGCPYQCVFCVNALNRRVRYQSPKRFVDEVEFLHKEYGFLGLNFQDDSFTVNTNHVKQICEEILIRNLKIKWYCNLRINNVSMDLLRLMKEAGCVALGYGIEIGSDRLLKIIKKGITTVQIREAAKITKELGFSHVLFFLMTSLPGQALEDIRISSEFMSEIYSIFFGTPVRRVFLGVPTFVYPGTEVEAIAQKNGNVLPASFSWNVYYKTNKAKIFDTNPYLPHFENPTLSLEEIKGYALKLEIMLCFPTFLNLLVNVKTLKDLWRLVKKTCKAFYYLLKVCIVSELSRKK